MRITLIAAILAAASTLFAAQAHCSCDCDCVAEFHADVSFCQTIDGDDPADTDSTCVDNARDDYYTCVEDCSDPLNLNLER